MKQLLFLSLFFLCCISTTIAQDSTTTTNSSLQSQEDISINETAIKSDTSVTIIRMNCCGTAKNHIEPLIIVDGRIHRGKLSKLKASKIKKIKVLKYEKAIKEYGDKAKGGVIIVETKGRKKKKRD